MCKSKVVSVFKKHKTVKKAITLIKNNLKKYNSIEPKYILNGFVMLWYDFMIMCVQSCIIWLVCLFDSPIYTHF